MYARRQQLVTVAIVSALIVSLIAFAGASAAVETTVTGPDEVDRPDIVEFQSTLDIRDGEQVPIENFTLTIQPADSPEESVTVTFAPDGTVLGISPENGTVGQGEIRIEQLRESLDITLVEQTTDTGYGYSYGYDERRGDERVEFGYGYGSTNGTFTYDIAFSSKALKHGSYELFLAVNTPSKTGQFQSNVEDFDVNVPSSVSPPDRGEGRDVDHAADDGGVDGADDEDAGDDAHGVDDDADHGPSTDNGNNGKAPSDPPGQAAIAGGVGSLQSVTVGR
ncbi:hypothetical protein [Halorarius litoreus]|uniref:hypothetical protein n=1 Tax=Halorarius litoreus TaxID=2962676 RepID=UPI0020CE8180|nr:hypothetical protein [Halorarius litoreus]